MHWRKEREPLPKELVPQGQKIANNNKKVNLKQAPAQPANGGGCLK